MLLKKVKLKKEEQSPIKIMEVNKTKIIFKCKFSWAICLNAYREKELSLFFLPNNLLNQERIKRIVSGLFFSCPKIPSYFSPPSIRGYQKEDIEFLSNIQNGAIFSETRTGKTPIALLVWEKWKVKNLLIIVPAIIQYHWQISTAEWLNRPAYIITSLKKKTRSIFYKKLQEEKDWIVIISKDTFRLDISEIEELKKNENFFQNCCVIVDEAHFLRNHTSKQSKSIYNLDSAIHKLILTGTPVVNNYSDVFGILKFLFPKKYSNFQKFLEEYFNINRIKIEKGKRCFFIEKVDSFKNKKKQQDLFSEINTFSVKREQKDVLPWLPKIIYQRELLLMDDEQQKTYNKIEGTKTSSVLGSFEILTKLKTVTLFPKLMGCKNDGVKISYIINYLKEQIKRQTNQSIVVFSTRSSTFLIPLAEKIKKSEKIEVQLITGKTLENKKRKIIENFQNKIHKVLFCNIKAANLGIELSQADIIIFADRSYSPADNEQAESRFLPPTKRNVKTKLVIDLICKGSVDEKTHKILREKWKQYVNK